MSAYSVAVLADTPDVYYRMDDATIQTTVADSSGNAHNATLNQNLAVQSAGLIATDTDTAMKINFNSGPFRADTGYTVSQEPLTVEFWINPTTLTSWGGGNGFNTPVACGVTGGWQARYVSITGVWQLEKQGATTHAFTAAAVAGTTQHVVFVLQTDHSVDLYINGAFSQNVSGATIVATTDFLTIGAPSSANGNLLDAIIDEIAIYKSALSGSQIAAHYTAAVGAPVVPQAGVNFLRKGDRRN